MAIKLVAWDMDGTLIDSESLAGNVIMQCARDHLGIEVDPTSFGGKDVTTILDELSTLYGGPLTEHFVAELDRDYAETMQRSLRATPNAAEALGALADLAHCVASNGEPDTIAQCLELVELSQYFGEAIFSARQVAHPKPAPDLYLFAAERLGFAPSETLVIEDSPLGIRAGLAAGMHVVGFAGNKPHEADTLAGEGVDVVLDMKQIPTIAKAIR